MATTDPVTSDVIDAQVKNMGGDDFAATGTRTGYIIKDGVPIKRVSWLDKLFGRAPRFEDFSPANGSDNK